jgi:hypothetical protein
MLLECAIHRNGGIPGSKEKQFLQLVKGQLQLFPGTPGTPTRDNCGFIGGITDGNKQYFFPYSYISTI